MKQYIKSYKNQITPEQSDKLIELFENDLQKDDLTMGGQERSMFVIDPKRDEALYDEVRALFAASIKEYLSHYILICDVFDTGFRIQKHTKGMIDMSILRAEMVGLVNVTLYLRNDAEKGASLEFTFSDDQDILTPNQGELVVFPASFPYFHKAHPPQEGSSYFISTTLVQKGAAEADQE